MMHHRFAEEVKSDVRRRQLQHTYCRSCCVRGGRYCLEICSLAESNIYHHVPPRPLALQPGHRTIGQGCLHG